MKTLLLNSDMQPLGFVSERRAIKFLIKEKVDVLCGWNDIRYYSISGFIELPAVIRLRHRIVRNAVKRIFSRSAVFKRDNYTCLYCSKLLSTKQITLDHIVPRSKGGVSSFENCATACNDCNTKKGSKMLEEIGMRLAKKPETPEGYLVVSAYVERWHPNWDIFICPNE